METHSGKNVMGVLPCCGRKYQRRFLWDRAKDIHSHPLAGDKTVTFLLVDWEGATQSDSQSTKDLRPFLFEVLLRWPTNLICCKPKISTCDRNHPSPFSPSTSGAGHVAACDK